MKNGFAMSGTTRPIVLRADDPPRDVTELGDAASTRRRVSSLTRGSRLITRDTVIAETPARRATSRIVRLIDVTVT